MPDRCVEEGGILLVSGTPWPSPRVPIFHSVSRSVSQCPPVPASVPRCMCAGCGPRLLFALVARQIHPMPPQVCVQICSNWGVDYPGPGISVGDRPGRMAKCMWGPSSFNSRPGWSGLCVPSALGGASREQGTEGDCNPAAQTAVWKVRPPVRLRYGHTVYNLQTGQPGGRMDRQAHGSRDNKPHFFLSRC